MTFVEDISLLSFSFLVGCESSSSPSPFLLFLSLSSLTTPPPPHLGIVYFRPIQESFLRFQRFIVTPAAVPRAVLFSLLPFPLPSQFALWTAGLRADAPVVSLWPLRGFLYTFVWRPAPSAFFLSSSPAFGSVQSCSVSLFYRWHFPAFHQTTGSATFLETWDRAIFFSCLLPSSPYYRLITALQSSFFLLGSSSMVSSSCLAFPPPPPPPPPLL